MSLRERKKLKTRLLIQEVALQLFREHGYDATTVDQIAEAAEVSPSTVYRYFASKEAIVFWDQWDPRIAHQLRERPAEEQPVEAMRAVLDSLFPEAMAEEADLIRARLHWILAEPSLRSHFAVEAERTIALFADVFAERAGRPADDLHVQVVVRAMFAALQTALDVWAREGGDLPALARRSLDLLGDGLVLAPLRPGRGRS